MRVAILTETYHPVAGGGESQARELARGLVLRGHSVLVITRRSSREFQPVESVDGAKVMRVPPAGPGHLKKWGLIPSCLWALVRARNEYDAVVVCGFRVLGIPAVLATRWLKKGCTLKADSLGEMSGDYFTSGLTKVGLSAESPLFRVFLQLRNLLYRKAGAFVAISEVIVQELLDSGVDPARIHVIPNSVDIERFKPVTESEKRNLRKDLGLPEDRMIATFTGRLVSYKGLKTLLQVWQELPAKGDPALLVLVGSGGLDIHNCEEELKDFVRTHRLKSEVVFAGEVARVEAYLQASDLFVFPSENEAFGISVIEAMAVGLPVLSSDTGGLAGIIESGRTGLAFPAGDERALADGLERLLLDAELRGALGRAAREAAVADYSSQRIVDGYATLIGAGIRG